MILRFPRLAQFAKATLCQTLFIASLCLLVACDISRAAERPLAFEPSQQVGEVVARLSAHDFHPIRDGFTFDRQFNQQGVANLDDQDWRVRTLAVRDLVRLGVSGTPALVTALDDKNADLRHVSVMTLGILRATNAVPALEKVLREDGDSVVRSQAAIALGQIGQRTSLAVVQTAQTDDKSRDVQHQSKPEFTAWLVPLVAAAVARGR